MRVQAALVAGLFSAIPAVAQSPYQVETLATGLDRPWAIAFLPGSSDILMTRRGGSFAIWEQESGQITPLTGGPTVDARGQGGLLDVAPAPDFAQSRQIYMTWVARLDGGGSTTHLGRAVLDREAGSITAPEVLHRVSPAIESTAHFGSRITFSDGHVFAGFGDRNFKNFGKDHIAQDLSSENGAVIRLTLDGEIPADNPFVDVPGAAGAIWSYGHRNIQAMATHPETDAVWLAEHGEAGGDEVNLVTRGGNYGWPLASFGVTYRGGNEFSPPHRDGDGFIAPVHHWPAGRDDHFPPSGMAFYTGDAFGDWQGHLLIGNLFQQYLGLFEVRGDGAALEPVARLLNGAGHRIRDVAVGPDDGFIYVLTDGDDARLLRLSPS